MSTSHDQVLVGVIVGAHGIKGEVKLKSFTSEPLSIGRYGPLQSVSGQSFEITKLKTHEAYAHDLMGLDVVMENGTTLGKLVAMPNYGAGDLLEVAVDGNSETVLIPFTNAFVPQDDFSNGSITVFLPEGYLDAE